MKRVFYRYMANAIGDVQIQDSIRLDIKATPLSGPEMADRMNDQGRTLARYLNLLADPDFLRGLQAGLNVPMAADEEE